MQEKRTKSKKCVQNTGAVSSEGGPERAGRARSWGGSVVLTGKMKRSGEGKK